MVTMQQIADRCGVSRGTVDRALHHKEGVREEVAERIRAAAREMGYISNRLVMQQTQQWKIGVVLHSGHSPFVQMLCELFESFSERALIPNITVIVRAMQDMDVQHQLTLIDELVTTEHIDGLALMPLANTLVRDKINMLSEQQGIPVVALAEEEQTVDPEIVPDEPVQSRFREFLTYIAAQERRVASRTRALTVRDFDCQGHFIRYFLQDHIRESGQIFNHCRRGCRTSSSPPPDAAPQMMTPSSGSR